MSDPANDNNAKSAFALLRPALQNLKELKDSQEWQDTLPLLEGINATAHKKPETNT